MLTVYLLAGTLLILGAILRTPWFRGWFGELQVNLAARLMLDRNVYRLVRNVTIRTADGTTQIDHVIVSRYGVFVVETKNMRGLIVGQVRQAEWRQYFGKRFFAFQNPLRQNYKHTQTLTELVGLPPEKIISIVVFVGSAKLDKNHPANVTETGEYIRFIKEHTTVVLTEVEVERVLSVIAEKRLRPGLTTHRDHIAHVRDLAAEKVRTKEDVKVAPAAGSEDDVVCPACGAPMVSRIAKKGGGSGRAFLGCSRFPACRGTREMEPAALP